MDLVGIHAHRLSIPQINITTTTNNSHHHDHDPNHLDDHSNRPPAPSSGSEAENIMATHYFRIGVLECLVAGLGTPANLLVLYFCSTMIFGCRRFANSTTTSSPNFGRRKVYNQWYVFSMTFADVLFCSIHAPMSAISYLSSDIDYSANMCRFLYVITHTATVASSLSLLCLNIDKFVAVYKALHHPLIMNRITTMCLLTATWCVAFTWAVLLTFGPLLDIEDGCSMTLRYLTAYYTFTVVFFGLPIIISFIISIYVVLIVARSMGNNCSDQKKIGPAGRRLAVDGGVPSTAALEKKSSLGNNGNGHAKQTICLRSSSSGPSGSAGAGGEFVLLYQRHRRRIPSNSTNSGGSSALTQHAKTLTFVFCSTLWSTLTSLPYRLVFVLSLLGYKETYLPMILFGLMSANALGNPFITLFTQRRYRSRLANILRCRSCKTGSN